MMFAYGIADTVEPQFSDLVIVLLLQAENLARLQIAQSDLVLV
jgi:hypothetical protein